MAREYIPVEIQRLVKRRANDQCEYCRSPSHVTPAPFSVEHIEPISRGGSSEQSNLAYSCMGCNLVKGTRVDFLDPVTGLKVLLFHPRQDKWGEHFGWSEDFKTIEAFTPKGRATIAALGLNRPEIQNLRWVLIRSKLHPPEDQ